MPTSVGWAGVMLFPGVRDMLKRLTGMCVDLHIASNGDPAHVDAVLRSARILHLFRSVRCGESAKERMVGEILGTSDRSVGGDGRRPEKER